MMKVKFENTFKILLNIKIYQFFREKYFQILKNELF